MKSPIQIKIGPPTDHFSEIVLLGLIAGGVIWLLAKAIDKMDAATGAGALDVAAFLLVLQAIITAIKERWTQRSVDRMGAQLGQSVPGNDPPPQNAAQGAQDAADAAERKAAEIARQAKPDDPEARL